MNVSLTIWDHLTRLVVFLLFIAGLLGVAVWYLPLIQQNERMRKELLRYDTLIKKEEESSKQLHGAMEGIRRDPKAIDRLVRERLGYAKPGETVIRFEAPATNSPPR